MVVEVVEALDEGEVAAGAGALVAGVEDLAEVVDLDEVVAEVASDEVEAEVCKNIYLFCDSFHTTRVVQVAAEVEEEVAIPLEAAVYRSSLERRYPSGEMKTELE